MLTIYKWCKLWWKTENVVYEVFKWDEGKKTFEICISGLVQK